jgi:predicted RNA binding protein YcfA (HicA-like mRNA interferase family)
MSKPLPAIKPTELIRALEKAGWDILRHKGSHLVMHKSKSLNILVIPMHNRDLPKGTLRGILNDADMSVEELIGHLNK